MKISALLVSALFGILLAPVGVSAQDQEDVEIPVLAGTWIGEFEDKSEWERDPADSQRASALLGGRGRVDCEGTLEFTFGGTGNVFEAQGTQVQRCRSQRGGELSAQNQLPLPLILEEIELKKEGREVRFDFRPGGDRTTVCETKMKWKKDQQFFEGSYKCRARGSGTTAMDRLTEGEFEIRKAYGGGL